MQKQQGNLFEQIRNCIEGLSPKQRQLAEYIIAQYKRAAFMTSTALGKAADVSESTVVRLAVELGYPGFPEFQAALQELIQRELTTIERFSITDDSNAKALYAKVLSAEAEHTLKVINVIAPKQFSRAVDLLHRQNKVFVVGYQVSACLASFCGYQLGKIRQQVYGIDKMDTSVSALLAGAGHDDLALVYAFPRYPANTIRLVKFFHDRKVPIIVITNSSSFSLAEMAEVLFPIPIRYDRFIDSLAPVFGFTNALIMAAALKDNQRTSKYLKQFEEFAAHAQIFEMGHTRPGE